MLMQILKLFGLDKYFVKQTPPQQQKPEWVLRIDAMLKTEEETAKKMKELQNQEDRAILLQRSKLVAVQHQEKMKKHGEKFHCSVCGKPSVKFGTRDVWQGSYFDGDYRTIEDENTPGDLVVCSKCGNWTCAGHIYRTICANCA